MAEPVPGAPTVPTRALATTPAPVAGADSDSDTTNENDQDKKPEPQGQKPLGPKEYQQIQVFADMLTKDGMDPKAAKMIAQSWVELQRSAENLGAWAANGFRSGKKTPFSKQQPEGEQQGPQAGPESSTFSAQKIDGFSEPMKSGFDHKGIIMDKDSAFIGDNTLVQADGRLFAPGVYKRNPESGELEKLKGEDAKKEYDELKSKHDELMNKGGQGQVLSFGDNSPTFTNLTSEKFDMSRNGPNNTRDFAKDISKQQDATAQLTAASEADPQGPVPAAPKPTFSREAEDAEIIPPNEGSKFDALAAEADGLEAPMSKHAMTNTPNPLWHSGPKPQMSRGMG